MTEKSTCFLKQAVIGLPDPAQEDIILDIDGEGICLLFSVPSPGGRGYTQERYFYAWETSRIYMLPDKLLMISGAPKKTIDRIPLMITQRDHSGRLVDHRDFTVVIKLTEDSVRAVKQAQQCYRG